MSATVEMLENIDTLTKAAEKLEAAPGHRPDLEAGSGPLSAIFSACCAPRRRERRGSGDLLASPYDQPMRERNGLVIAALVGAFATAAFSVGNVILGAALTVVTVLLLLGSFADRLPALHRLPLVGAAPLPAVEFHFEDTGRRTFVMDHAPQDAVLVVGLTNDGHNPIPGTLLNAYVVGSTEIQRCTQDGDRYVGGGGRLRGPDAPYWSQSDVTIGRGSTVWFFKVTMPGPGDYHAYLLLNSPAFYGREDVRYDAQIRAVAR